MACHVCDCVLDYSPLAAFWAFSFERYYGTLESMKISWCGPEKQMLKKFLDIQSFNDFHEESDNYFTEQVYKNTIKSVTNFTSVDQMSFDTVFLTKQCHNYSCAVHDIDGTEKYCYQLMPPFREGFFSDHHMQYIVELYELIYPDCEVQVSRQYLKCKKVLIGGEEYITSEARSSRSAAVIAHWPNVIGIDKLGEAPARVGILTSIFRHSATIKKPSGDVTKLCLILAHVRWFQDHPQWEYLAQVH